MGSRYVGAVLGAVMLVCATAFLSTTVEPRMAGATTANVKTCGGESITLKAREKRTLALHNMARADRGLRPLCVDPRLTRAARSHSRQMVKKDYFSHNSYNGESVGARLRRFGYDCSVCGENIAGGTVRTQDRAPPSNAGWAARGTGPTSWTGGSGGSAWEPTRATTRASRDTSCTRSISGAGAEKTWICWRHWPVQWYVVKIVLSTGAPASYP